MSEYTNGFQINVNPDVARIKFLDISNLQVNPKEITEIIMNYDTFKLLHAQMGDVIEKYNEKLANAKKIN